MAPSSRRGQAPAPAAAAARPAPAAAGGPSRLLHAPPSRRPAPSAHAPAAPPPAPPVIRLSRRRRQPPARPPPAAVPGPATRRRSAGCAEERINELIGRYKEALESTKHRPGEASVAVTERRRRNRNATGVPARRGITVEIGRSPDLCLRRGRKVTFIRTYNILTVEGQRLQSTSQAVMDVQRTGNSWVIDAIRFLTAITRPTASIPC